MTRAPAGERPPLFAVALVSAGALALEVLLIRLLSIIQWHHFATMVISLALLGYGASGTFLTVARRPLSRHWSGAFVANVLCFGIAAFACFAAVQRVSFNAEELLWDPRQPLRLACNYLLLALPFFFAANAVGMTLQRYGERIGRVYAADLLGAGVGSVAAVAALFVLFPMSALGATAVLGAVAAALAAWEMRQRQRGAVTALALAVAATLVLAGASVRPAVSPYKSLSQSLRITGAQIVRERSSPLGWLAVVENPRLPLRHAPGLSLGADAEPPSQVAVFTDGDAMTAITRDDGDPTALGHLGAVTSALPYALRPLERVLVLGAGGGAEVLQALALGAAAVDAVELNPQLVDLVRGDYREFSGGLYDRAQVRVQVGDARGFVGAGGEAYDLVQIVLVDSFAAAAAAVSSLSENYLYTVEAVRAYLGRLRPQGYLAITRWLKLPPRDALKLFATAVDALRASGVNDPGAHLALIRGWQTSTLLVKKTPFDAEEIARIGDFTQRYLFDSAYFPGIEPEQANRFNRFDRPYLFTGTQALLGPGRSEFMRAYKFDLSPASDDRPFFSHFFRWRVLPEILALRGRGGLPLLEWGYLVLTATLVQALLASFVLILLPLVWLTRREPPATRAAGRARTLGYFVAIGLAFLFVEIAYIQKLILVFHHPVYAVAVGLSAFLLFAGLGSACSRWLRQRVGAPAALALAVAGIVGIGALHLLLLEPMTAALAEVAPAAKLALVVAALAPLAFCMGLPFPLGLTALTEAAPSLVPWAWGVNGCASVVSAVLANLLAVHLGFRAVIVAGLALYLLVPLCAAPTRPRPVPPMAAATPP